MAKNLTKNNVSVTSDVELLSYIINSDPILSAEIELPVQGDNNAVKNIGKLIMSNERHKNAFINAVNVIGLTVIHRHMYKNPWSFTNKGTINAGESLREIVVGLVDAKDYNLTKNNVTSFLDNEVPNVLSCIHEINWQKYYKTTTDDVEMAMAFNEVGGLFRLIDTIIGKMPDSLEEDLFVTDKYQLARRIVDGTTGIMYVDSSSTTREIVAEMQTIVNNFGFINGNYNPAAYEYECPEDEIRTIFDTKFDGRLHAELLATSFFKDEADIRTRRALANSFVPTPSEEKRLRNLLNLSEDEVLFTDDEKAQLEKIKGVIMDENFFQDRVVALGLDGVGDKRKTFENPETLKTNHWLHAWRLFATSPYAHIVAITTGDKPTITGINVKLNGTTIDDAFTIANNTAGTIVLDTEIEVVGTNIYNKAYFVEITDESNRVTYNSETKEFSIKGGSETLSASVTITSIGNKEVVKEFTITTTSE